MAISYVCKKEVRMKTVSPLRKVTAAGFSTLFIITATALLHANKAEFILDRFPAISSVQFALFDSVLYLAYLAGGLFIGIIAARTGKRKLYILIGSLGTAGSTIILTVLDTYTAILAVRFIQGLFAVSAWQMLMTLVLDLSNPANRGKHMGIFGTLMGIAMGTSPAAGGFLASVSLFTPYYAGSAAALAAFLTAALFLEDPANITERERKLSYKSMFLLIVKKPLIIVPSLFNFVDRLHMGFIIFALPLLIRDVLKLPPSYRGMILGINGTMYIILQYPIGRLSDTFGRYRLLVFGSLGYGILLGLTGPAAALGFIPLAILFAVLGVFSGFTGPPNSALLGDLVEPEENPLAMGFFSLWGNIGIVAGPLIAAFFYQQSAGAAFLAAGIIELTALGFGMVMLKIWTDKPALAEKSRA
jgi:MFS transporter, DHA1 family, tetracycline resistance protein